MNISLDSITTKGKSLPPRIVLYTTAGWGKTSMFSFSKAPVFLMAKGETGLETLMAAKQIPETAHFPELETWGEVLGATKALMGGKHEYKTVVLDAGGGFEALLHQSVCDEKYNGNWGDKGFMSFMQGYTASLPQWMDWLSQLDALRERGMTIVILCHTQIKPFSNPEGENYDRFQALMHHKTWGVTERWSDIVLFGTYYTHVEKQGGKAKATGGRQRIIYTQRTAAYDAKNRHGLPEQIEIPGDGPESAYKALREAFAHA